MAGGDGGGGTEGGSAGGQSVGTGLTKCIASLAVMPSLVSATTVEATIGLDADGVPLPILRMVADGVSKLEGKQSARYKTRFCQNRNPVMTALVAALKWLAVALGGDNAGHDQVRSSEHLLQLQVSAIRGNVGVLNGTC